MKKTFLNLKKASFYTAIILIWCILSAVVLIAMNIQTSLAAIAILVFVAVLSVIRPFPLASWLSVLAGSLAFTLICYSLFGLTRMTALTSGLAFVIYLSTSLLGNTFAGQIGHLRDQLEKEQTLLDDLVQYDQSTGILRWKYAQQRLKAEVLRSVRYKKDLSLLFMQVMIPEHAQFSENELANLYSQVVEVAVESLRKDIDVPFIGEKLGIFLPETTSEGAQILAARLADKVLRKTRVDVVIGIASVPNDAVTDEALVEQAEMALKFAAGSDQTIVPAARLRSALKEQAPLEAEPAPTGAPREPSTEPLEADEWLLEIDNFKNMEMLPDLEKLITAGGAAHNLRFVQLKKSRLIVKVSADKTDLPKELGAQSRLTVSSVDPEQRTIRLELKAEK